jgi:hypothetical protein
MFLAKSDVYHGITPWSYYLKGILPLDIIKRLPPKSRYQNSDLKRGQIRAFLKMFSSVTIERFIREDNVTTYSNMLLDTIAMWYQLPFHLRVLPNGTNSLKTIHDRLMVSQRKWGTPNVEIKHYSKEVVALDGTILDNHKIIVPKTSYELLEWGTHLNNCVASYASRKESQIIGVEEDGVLTYCLEVRDDRVIQFKTYHNKDACGSVQEKIMEYLKGKDVVEAVRVGWESRHWVVGE